MIFEYFPLGMLGANCYILGCEQTKEAVVIDPGGEPKAVLKFLLQNGLKLKYVINTHGHFDHTTGNDELRRDTGAKVLIHEADHENLVSSPSRYPELAGNIPNPKPADGLLKDGDKLEVGNFTLEVLHTPGHSKGGICLLTGDKVFVGDTLFNGSIGRTDFTGGNYEELINSVNNKLFVLPDKTKVYCGHGPETTIGYEKKTNPFFR